MLIKYLLEENILIYGISRKGIKIEDLQTLPDHHVIINIDITNPKAVAEFINKIPKNIFNEINYFHLVGEFKTEINKNLEIIIDNDNDKDGIDDTVYKLVFGAYEHMVTNLNNLSKNYNYKLNIISLGSLADIYNIECFTSFRKSRIMVELFSQKIYSDNKNVNIYLFNTSTILSVDELIERPYIFTTNVNPLYWITPTELIKRATDFIESEKGFIKKDIYLPSPNFNSNYFDNHNTYKRRVKELYNKDL